jgi:hypothetical protein
MKNAVFWDVTRCGSYMNHTRAIRRHIPDDGILQTDSLLISYELPKQFAINMIVTVPTKVHKKVAYGNSCN